MAFFTEDITENKSTFNIVADGPTEETRMSDMEVQIEATKAVYAEGGLNNEDATGIAVDVARKKMAIAENGENALKLRNRLYFKFLKDNENSRFELGRRLISQGEDPDLVATLLASVTPEANPGTIYERLTSDNLFALAETNEDVASYRELQEFDTPVNDKTLVEDLSENITKMQIIQKHQSRMANKFLEQGTPGIIGDIAEMFIPLSTLLELGGITEEAETSVFSGENFRLQREEFGRIVTESSPEELDLFLQNLGDRMLEKGIVQDNQLVGLDTFFTITNPEFSDIERNTRTGFEILDVGTSLAILPKLIMAPLSASTKAYQIITGAQKASRITEGLKKTGNTDKAAEIVSNNLLKSAESKDTLIQSIEDVLPSGWQPTNSFLGEGIPGAIEKKIENSIKTRKFLESNIVTPPRRSQATYAEAATDIETRIANRYKLNVEGQNVIPYDTSVRTNEEGVRIVDLLVGKNEDSLPFQSEAAARFNAFRKGWADDGFDVIESPNGDGFLVRLSQPIDEAQLNEPIPFENFKLNGMLGPVWKFINSPDTYVSEDVQRAMHLTEDARSAMIEGVTDMAATLKSLSKSQATALNAVMDKGRLEGKWFNTDELQDIYRSRFNRDATENEIISYYNLKEVNDLDFSIRNSKLRSDLTRKGYKYYSNIEDNTLQIGEKTLEGQPLKVRKQVDDLHNLYIWDGFNNRIIRPGAEGDEVYSELRDLVNKGEFSFYQMLEPSPDTFDNYPVGMIFARKTQVQPLSRELPKQILNYTAGGHRLYSGRFFVKQGRISTAPDGTQYIASPLTHHVFETRADAQRWVERYNTAIKAYRNHKADPEVFPLEKTNEIISSNFPTFNSVSKIDAAIRQGDISDRPFELVTEGNPLPSLIGLEKSPQLRTSFAKEQDLDQLEWYRFSKNVAFSQHKGEHLKDPQGDLAPTLDLFESTERAVVNAIRTRVYGEYQAGIVDRFLKTVDGMGLNNNPDPTGLLSPTQRLANFTPIEKTQLLDKFGPDGLAFANNAERLRDHILRQLNFRTPLQRRFDKFMENTFRQIETRVGGKPDGRFTKFLERQISSIESKGFTAPDRVRSLMFNAKLGFFDVSQLFIQPLTAVAAVTADPISGLAAWRRQYALRTAIKLNRANDEEGLRFLFNRLGRESGFKSFEEMMFHTTTAQSLGKFEVGNVLSLLDEDFNAGRVLGLSNFEKVKGTSRIFFDVGERTNRIVGFEMALQRFLKSNPDVIREVTEGGKKVTKIRNLTADELSIISRDSDAFALNMTRASTSFWQKGLPGVGLQFMSFPWRMMELMYFDGNVLTRAERLRLVLGQMALYGASGLPLPFSVQELDPPGYYESINQIFADNLSPESYRLVTTGLLDGIINAGLEELDIESRTALGTRAGTSGNNTIFNEIFFDDENPLRVLTGPAGDFIGNMSEELPRAFRIGSAIVQSEELAERDPEFIANFVLTSGFLQEISSLSRASRAYYIWQYGRYFTRNGSELGLDVNKFDAFLTALGIPLSDVNTLYHGLNIQRDRRQIINEYAKDYGRLMRELAVASQDNDEERVKSVKATIAARFGVIKQEDPVFLKDILRKVQQDQGDKLYESFIRRAVPEDTPFVRIIENSNNNDRSEVNQ